MKNILLSLTIIFVSIGYSYNKIHDAQYQLYPEKFKSNQSKIYIGAISSFNGDLLVPIGAKLGISNSVEGGVRLNLWGDNDYSDYQPQLNLGFSVLVRKNDYAQADILIGLGNNQSNGAALSYNMKRWVTNSLTTIYQIKLGFFDGITGGNLCHTELGFYPKLRIASYLDMQASFNWSSALSDDLVQKSSFDFAPGFRYRHSKNTTINFDVGFGVAGNNQESDMRFNFGIINDF